MTLEITPEPTRNEAWMVIAITRGGEDLILDHHGLSDFIDDVSGDNNGVEVPKGTEPGLYAVRNCKVYGNPDEEEREPTTIEGEWVKLRDLSPVSAADLDRPTCVNHPHHPSVTNLDGDNLCQDCANAWVRGEGDHARYLEEQEAAIAAQEGERR